MLYFKVNICAFNILPCLVLQTSVNDPPLFFQGTGPITVEAVSRLVLHATGVR